MHLYSLEIEWLKMKIQAPSYFLLLISVLAFSCNINIQKEETKQPEQDPKAVKKEDTVSVEKKVNSYTPSTGPKRTALIELLENPIDLKVYKKKKRGANGTTRSMKVYDFKPDTLGNYYTYFWFHELRRRFRTESESVDAVFIDTYISGEEIGTYHNVEEVLIGIKSRISDEDLGMLNFVGKTVSELRAKYEFKRSEDFLFTEIKGVILILHIADEKVDWFRYIRTTLLVKTLRDIPSELLQYKG